MQFNALEKEAKRVNNEHITGLCDRVTSFPQIMNYYEFTVSNIKQQVADAKIQVRKIIMIRDFYYG